jgi:hypothetical protein
LEQILEIVPREKVEGNNGPSPLFAKKSENKNNFVLEIKTYTRILEYLIKKKAVQSF